MNILWKNSQLGFFLSAIIFSAIQTISLSLIWMPEFCRWLFWNDGTVKCEEFAASGISLRPFCPFWRPLWPATLEDTSSALEFPARLCWWFCRIIRIWKFKIWPSHSINLARERWGNHTLSVAVLKCSISVKKVLEAEVLDSLLILAPRGGTLALGSRQHRICWWTFEYYRDIFKACVGGPRSFNWNRSRHYS